jgi:RHS repeat-associated protein
LSRRANITASSGNIGGAAPYWTNYTVDPATGNRLSTTENPTTVGGTSTTDTYSYLPAGGSTPHAVQSVSHVTGGSTTTSSYGYDAAGNTTTRPGQSLTYDAEGKTSSVTAGSATQSDVYDASGNLLLEKDSTAGTTLFLGATELHLAPGATTASAVRTYTSNGIPVAERSTVAGVSGSTLTWLGADAQGTVDLQMNVTTGAFGVRLQDPFGQARGASTTTWGDGHGFLNATTDALSGLVQLGARMYDASIGRFLSVDPVLSPGDPQQNNGYSYAHNTPVDLADPNGLDPAEYWNPSTAPATPYVPPGSAPAAGGNKSSGHASQSSSFDPLAGFKAEIGFDVDFFQGFGNAAVAIGRAIWAGAPLNYIIQAVNPFQGPVESWNSLNAYLQNQTASVLTFANNPGPTTVAVLGDLVDAKDWSAHPGKSAGTVGFSVVLAALTIAGGTGAAGAAGDAEGAVIDVSGASPGVVPNAVIGKLGDLNNIGDNEYTLLDRMQRDVDFHNTDSPKATFGDGVPLFTQ